ncbi:hypothetical protein [Chitinophaga caeni]|nr:hypothetical protein [Chitinophaga caeni]
MNTKNRGIAILREDYAGKEVGVAPGKGVCAVVYEGVRYRWKRHLTSQE